MTTVSPPPNEYPVAPVRGTRDWPPEEFAGLATLEAGFLDRFARAGYAPMRTPALEPVELHERKSGAGIVSRLFELSDAHQARLCLRPELTASIVRAYTDLPEAPSLPWRVSMAGPVFRFESDPQPGHYREFTQVGVELLGAPGAPGDAEVIALAHAALADVGLHELSLRIGHVGLILEWLDRSGLPASARGALVDSLSLASSEGGDLLDLDAVLGRFDGWLRTAEADSPTAGPAVDGDEHHPQVDRLFRQLVPDVAGRRSGREILGRLRRKWELAQTLRGVVGRVRDRARRLADLHGPMPLVLDRLRRELTEEAPTSVATLAELVRLLECYGLDPSRITLDLRFSRGIGFYSQAVFSLVAATPDGPVEVGGGGRYDGLARVLGSDRDDRGVGFALGLERVARALQAAGKPPVAKAGRGGCLVVAPRPAFEVAAGIAADFRRFGDEPVVGPDPIDDPDVLAAAFDRAAALGLAEVALVRGPRTDPGGLTWYAWDGREWSRREPDAPILLARLGGRGEVRR
jgi:histidyl-tRNA synthetase